jgi:hypothetical protein
VNFRNQNYFSRPHKNKTFPLPSCREIKLQILKKKSYIYWFTLLGVVTWSLEGYNPYPLVTLGSGMRRLPYDPPHTRNVISVSKPSRVGGRHSPLYALNNVLPQQSAASRWREPPPPLAYCILSHQHTLGCLCWFCNQPRIPYRIYSHSLLRYSCFLFTCSQFLHTLLKSSLFWGIMTYSPLIINRRFG